MDVSATSSSLATNANDQVGTSVLKKAMDAEKQSAQALIDSATKTVSSANLPPNLGQNVNTTA